MDYETCPGCGCEPEVTDYFRRSGTRVGYRCACGTTVIDGVVTESDSWGFRINAVSKI